VNVVGPVPNAETVEVLLDTTWRLASAEAARTDALDRKAANVATFTSVLAVLTATLGIRFVEELESWWAVVVFVAGLSVLTGSVLCAVLALMPREYLTLGTAYLRRFPTWGEILKPPERVRGETMRGLVEAIANERETNDRKIGLIRWSFIQLLVGLVLIAAEGATLGFEDMLG